MADGLDRLRQRRRVLQLVVLAGEVVGLAGGRRPQPGDDLELLGEPLEPLLGVRERDAVGLVLRRRTSRPRCPAPPGRSLIASTRATWIASTPGWRNVALVISVPSRIVMVSRASPASVVQASVGPGRPSTADRQVVVGAEERSEAELLGGADDREEVVVRRALLGLGHHPELDCHGATFQPSPNAPTGEGGTTGAWMPFATLPPRPSTTPRRSTTAPPSPRRRDRRPRRLRRAAARDRRPTSPRRCGCSTRAGAPATVASTADRYFGFVIGGVHPAGPRRGLAGRRLGPERRAAGDVAGGRPPARRRTTLARRPAAAAGGHRGGVHHRRHRGQRDLPGRRPRRAARARRLGRPGGRPVRGATGHRRGRASTAHSTLSKSLGLVGLGRRAGASSSRPTTRAGCGPRSCRT